MKLVFITDAWRPVTGGGQKRVDFPLVCLARQGKGAHRMAGIEFDANDLVALVDQADGFA